MWTLIALGMAMANPEVLDRPAVGDKAPAFELPATTGRKARLKDFKGKQRVVLAFYPKAFTGG
jgi:peroxiredoxin Q/BCP